VWCSVVVLLCQDSHHSILLLHGSLFIHFPPHVPQLRHPVPFTNQYGAPVGVHSGYVGVEEGVDNPNTGELQQAGQPLAGKSV
jgi:hypothetical protein